MTATTQRTIRITQRRPPTGWGLLLLLLLTAAMPSIAASESLLRLPVEPLLWAGLSGVLCGVWLAGRRRELWLLLVAILGGLLWVGDVGNALPPSGLVAGDLQLLWQWLRDMVEQWVWPVTPEFLVPQYSWVALMRFANELWGAPSAGERGARLMVAVGGVVLTWIGAVWLGRAVRRGQAGVTAGLPLLAALICVGVIGGRGGTSLVIGIALLLLLAVIGRFHSRETVWERTGVDYSDQLLPDMAAWGGLMVVLVLLLAWAVPLCAGNPPARL
ncbi:MAG TPA: hypothetical protein PKC19_17970, partial [Roseiflexaceae bacterium]|nr:hypothetical protein [Roseiflexaceae bacterium]